MKMTLNWIKSSPSLTKGITVVNQLEDTKFDALLQRIISKIKALDSEIFTQEEINKLLKIFKVGEESLLLGIKTIVYMLKRMLKFVFMPADLKSDLEKLGLCNEKADVFVKLWSADTRVTLQELGPEFEGDDNFTCSWNLSAELSSDVTKKCKVPKAYVSLSSRTKVADMELTKEELNTMFLQLEAVQQELDNCLE